MVNAKKFKELLKKEVPEVNYSFIRSKTLQKIRDFEEKRQKQGFYFLPKAGMNLLLILIAVSVYGLIEELINLRGILGAPSLSWFYFFKTIAVLGDNVFIVTINLWLILLLDKRFLGFHRLYKSIRNGAVLIKNIIVKVPTAAWAFVRRS